MKRGLADDRGPGRERSRDQLRPADSLDSGSLGSAVNHPPVVAADRAFAAYGRQCRDCGRSDVPLELHHVNGDPTDNRIVNTIPLCHDCHHRATFPASDGVFAQRGRRVSGNAASRNRRRLHLCFSREGAAEEDRSRDADNFRALSLNSRSVSLRRC